jgi:hypothetical protein
MLQKGKQGSRQCKYTTNVAGRRIQKFAIEKTQQKKEKLKNNLGQKSKNHESVLVKCKNIINKIVITNRIVGLNAYYFQTGKQKTRGLLMKTNSG